jgi:hypothetical protein
MVIVNVTRFHFRLGTDKMTSGGRDAGERAKALLNWLIDVYKEAGDEELQPNEFSYSDCSSMGNNM